MGGLRECKYLDGENVAPRTAADAKKLIGKRVQYLRDGDIDRSGRGYFFPRWGTIIGVFGRNIEMDHEHNYMSIGGFVEMTVGA